MTQDTQLIISGLSIPLIKRAADKLEGINMGEKLPFDFYNGAFNGVDMLFVKPKGKNPTPKKCELVATRMSQLFKLPVVFILSPSPTYERQRLLEKGV